MTDTPTIYTAHDIPDLIAALPTLFGFRPTESLVGVATRGERRRFGFRLRVDIPEPEQVEAVAALVASHLKHQGAEGAILIAVTTRQDVAATLLAAVERCLVPVQIVVSVRADGERYWSDEPGFPDDGIVYTVSDHHLSIVQAIAAGQEIVADRETLAERFRAVGGQRRRWMEHATVTVLDQVIPVVSRLGSADLAAAGMEAIGPTLERGLGGRAALSDDELLRFSVWVSSISVRDAVWTRITRDNAADMLALLAQVARTAVPPFEPAVLSLASFAAWLTGDGAQALIAVERALRADPEYSMALLLLEMLERGVSPEHWTGFETPDA